MIDRRVGGFLVFTAALAASDLSRAQAISISAPYSERYTLNDIGSVPGLPARYGGLTFKPKENDTLLIGGVANEATGEIYAIDVVRDANHHITGFAGTASVAVEGAFNDGGVTFGPLEVMFLARWPNNEIAQIKPESIVIDKLVDLTPLGVVSSPGGLTFVPSDHPRAGSLKTASWPTGEWYDLTYQPDALGTFDITAATQRATLPGGPEGFIYVPLNSPLFPARSLLVSEFSAGEVAAFELDDDSDPIIATRTPFITGLVGAEGALTDPLTGDFLFSTFGGGSRVIVVQGFTMPTGAPCAVDSECSSGFCATGVCCATACDGECQTCALAGGATEDGACASLSGDPCSGDACTEDGTCDNGVCVGDTIQCSPSSDCVEVTGCDAVTGCQELARPDGEPCNGGACLAGSCLPDQGGGEGEGEGEGDGPPLGGSGCGCSSDASSPVMIGGALSLMLLLRGRRRVRR